MQPQRMEFNNKMTVLNMIHENRKVLFGKHKKGVTHEQKLNKWKEITEQLSALGIFEKDYKFLRDTTWQNWRKRSIDKRDKLKTGEGGGGKKYKYDEADELIFKIMSEDNSESTVAQLGLAGESSEDDVDRAAKPEIQIIQGVSSVANGLADFHQEMMQEAFSQNKPRLMRRNTEDTMDLQRQKLKAEVALVQEKVEIAKRERYKLDLELFKLEKELNLAQPSAFTLPYYI